MRLIFLTLVKTFFGCSSFYSIFHVFSYFALQVVNSFLTKLIISAKWQSYSQPLSSSRGFFYLHVVTNTDTSSTSPSPVHGIVRFQEMYNELSLTLIQFDI